MNRLPVEKKVAVITALCEGCSVRSVSRMTGVAKGTILRLLADVGTACADYQDRVLRNLGPIRVQVDEIWSFVGAKQKNVTPEMAAERVCGDAWTFVAIDADSKLAITWLVGRRDAGTATEFLQDLQSRLSNRIQLTTDGHKMYLGAVIDAFAPTTEGIDYAQLFEIYGDDPEASKRYSPARCLGIDKVVMLGDPDFRHVSSSFVERQNAIMRMNMRRFTRLTNAFSKKAENHMHAVALFYMHYNFCRIHHTLRVTPAMAAGVTDNLWPIHEIIRLSENQAAVAA